MGLREQAAADLKAIVEDEAGFGWPINLKNPAGESVDLVGLSTDVAQTIDPETGQAVSGRVASVAISLKSLEAVEWWTGIPKGIADSASRPYVVVFNDILGSEHTFKVQASNPDRAIGVVTLLLEVYQP